MKRVLIVDDAIDLGRLLQDALRTTHPGILTNIVPSAEEALLESTRLNIDLLVTDVRLPGMSGLELVRKIRIRQPTIKVMVITGINLDSRTQKQLDEAKVDVFRRKPLSITEFIDVTDSLLGYGEPEKTEEPAAAQVVQPAPPSASEQELLKVLADAPLPGEPVAASQPGAGRSTLPRKTAPLSEPADVGLSGRLTGLRSTLSALAVLLIDERGHVVAQAGDLPESNLIENLVAPLAASLSASSQISYAIGQTETESVHAFRGKTIDLVAAPVGQYTLLLAVRPSRSALRLALAFEEALHARADLAVALAAMGLRVRIGIEASTPEAVLDDSENAGEKTPLLEEEALSSIPEQDSGLEKFEEILKLSTAGVVSPTDADSFWESASENERADSSAPGMLSYEQARKLGLLPKENDQ